MHEELIAASTRQTLRPPNKVGRLIPAVFGLALGKGDLASNLHFELRVIHTCSHIGYIVNGTISPMKDPGVTAIGFLDLPGRYPRLLIAILAIGANESHVFVINRRNANVELIDSVDYELDIGSSQLRQLHALADFHLEGLGLLSKNKASN